MTKHPPKYKQSLTEQENQSFQKAIQRLEKYPDSLEDDIKYEIKLVCAISYPQMEITGEKEDDGE